MQRSMCSLVLSGLLTVAGSAALAQSDNSSQTPAASSTAPAAGAMPVGGHHAMTPDQQAEHLAKKLQLSNDQESQIKPILTDRQQQMTAIHQDQLMSEPDKRAKMKGVRDDSNAKIEAVLNVTQKQKFEQMQARQQEHGHRRHPGEAVTPANSPS